MMNAEQVEAAARALCKLRGIDPDNLHEHTIRSDFGWVPVIYPASPKWKLVAEEIVKFEQVQIAIDVALKGKP